MGVAADVEVTAEGVAAKDRGVAENNGMAPVSPDVRGATPDEALIEATAPCRSICRCMANSDAFDSIRASESIPLRSRTLESMWTNQFMHSNCMTIIFYLLNQEKSPSSSRGHIGARLLHLSFSGS